VLATGRPSVRGLFVLAATVGAVAWSSSARDRPSKDAAAAIGVRNAHAMAYDARRGRVVLFGGADAAAVRGDTWEWNGSAWTLAAASGPPPRTFPAMACDARRGRILMFGGNRVLFGSDPPADGTFLGDTWEWDGGAWSRIDAPGPSPRAEAAMAYDAARGRVVLFGGYDRVEGKIRRLGDTWEWDGSRWRLLTVAGPSARSGAAEVFDGVLGAVVLVGGRTESGTSAETWAFDGARWTDRLPASPEGIFNAAMAWDQARTRIVRFGGYRGKQRVGETWELDGAAWMKVSETGPAPRNHAAMAYDARRRRTVLFGGHDGERVFGDTWEWDGAGWRLRQSAAPRAHEDNGH
jgi:hypothetical protein